MKRRPEDERRLMAIAAPIITNHTKLYVETSSAHV